jgi:hypothetical protein
MLNTTVLLSLALHAAPPTGDQVKSVLDYFYNGQGKPAILVDAVLCKDIERKNKDTKYDCNETFGDSADKGATVNVYLTFLVPKGDSAEFMVQAVLDGVVRSTKDVEVKGQGIRSRTWKAFTLKKEGKWEFKVLSGADAIKTVSITAG